MTTTEVSTLSERELDRALAEAIGWVLCRSSAQNAKREVFLLPPSEADTRSSTGRFVWPRAIAGDDETFSDDTLPHYATSIDALGEVEARLREAGWRMTLWSPGPSGVWQASWVPPQPALGGGGHAPTEARARAEASLMALQALNSPTKEIAND